MFVYVIWFEIEKRKCLNMIYMYFAYIHNFLFNSVFTCAVVVLCECRYSGFIVNSSLIVTLTLQQEEIYSVT